MKNSKQIRRAAARAAAFTVPLSLVTLAQTPSPVPAGTLSEYLIEDAGFSYSSGSSTIEVFPRINESGQVAALLETKGRFGARTNAALNSFTIIPPLEEDFTTEVGDINAAGSMAGTSRDIDGGRDAVRFQNGDTQDLNVGDRSEGLGINDDGDVTGFTLDRETFAQQAFLKRSGQSPQMLTNSEDYDFGEAVDVSNAGTPLVNARPIDGSLPRAYRFSQGELNTVPLVKGANYNRGYGINDSDVVVGEVGGISLIQPPRAFAKKSSVSYGLLGPQARGPRPQGGQFFSHAFRHVPGQAPEDLGTLGDNESAVAYGVNNDADVVGESGGSAFIYQDGQGMRDLNTLIPQESGWFLREATAINDSGQIVGTGRFNGQLRVFRLTPRPTSVGELRVGPASVNFGSIGIGRYGVARVTVRNTGGTSVTALVGSPDNPFSIRLPESEGRAGANGIGKPGTQGGQGTQIFLAPGQRLQIRAYFVPRKRRRYQSRILITPQGSNQPIRVRLTGQGC